jgi:DNA-binding NarL/FixJ family response regulator
MTSPNGFGATEETTRVFLVDEHPAIRTVLKQKINEEENVAVVGDAAAAKEALPKIERTIPDVAIVEISLVEVDGLTLTERIRSRVPETQVLIFSRYDESAYAEWAIRAGASGYLMKTEPIDEVMQAIRKVEQGHIYLPQSILSEILDRVIHQTTNPPDSGLSALTMREITVFQMLGDGSSMSQIANNLDLSRKTVETYRRQVKKKLGCETTDELLKYAVLWTRDQVREPSGLRGGGTVGDADPAGET